MRKIELGVPAEIFADFTEQLEESGLENRITGKNEDDEILVEVYYDKSDSETADKLEEWLEDAADEYYNSQENEDEDEV